jgi:peptidoglycan biosynthesis protein MviN/MurJ (putative lipid II flippase)
MMGFQRGNAGEFRRGSRFCRRIALHLITYAIVVAILIGVNAVLGGPWWSLGIAAIWGGFLVLRFVVMAIVWRAMAPKGPRGGNWRGTRMT